MPEQTIENEIAAWIRSDADLRAVVAELKVMQMYELVTQLVLTVGRSGGKLSPYGLKPSLADRIISEEINWTLVRNLALMEAETEADPEVTMLVEATASFTLVWQSQFRVTARASSLDAAADRKAIDGAWDDVRHLERKLDELGLTEFVVDAEPPQIELIMINDADRR